MADDGGALPRAFRVGHAGDGFDRAGAAGQLERVDGSAGNCEGQEEEAGMLTS